MQLEKNYSPKEVETRWLSYWKENELYNVPVGKSVSNKETFSVLMPPPNVTGSLTIGHVLNHTIQDIFIRYARMQGKETLWLPGSDHAGIATQTVVEKKLKKEKHKTRYDVGREDFLKEVWAWKEEYGSLIVGQLNRLGISCDWKRNLFTMDDSASETVKYAFIEMYKQGLIYRGKRFIHWCPVSQTALSDEEVIMKERKDFLVYVKYPLSDNPNECITIATVRPETILADVAVAVHPNDERFKHLVGKKVVVPICKRVVPVIADERVEMDFGTGCLKITPAHDVMDYEIGLQHGLPIISVIGKDGTMIDDYGYKGQDRFKARENIIANLEKEGAVVKKEEYVHNVGFSERADVPIEPMLSEQWFVKMEPLAIDALRVVEENNISFHPDFWKSTYRNWMTNIKDWCISRQLWWGHRIPAYYAGSGEFVIAHSLEDATKQFCEKGIDTTNIVQDEDVLDTWFSSWLWPLTTFRWKPNESNADMDAFYPTAVLVTGPDIIFFWVARMIIAGLLFKKEIPFRDVYFTSIIRDAQGRKLSKTLGNSPNPIDVIDSYGADALRFTVIYLSPLGQDIRFAKENCELGRNFVTKIWNATRFLLMNRDTVFLDSNEFAKQYEAFDVNNHTSLEERWITARLMESTNAYHEARNNFRLNDMAKAPYDFLWDSYCDWFIEFLKHQLQTQSDKERRILFAITIFEEAIKLLHPVMPFVTEELWQTLTIRKKGESISITRFAVIDSVIDMKSMKTFGLVQKIISELRSIKANLGVPPSVIATTKFISSREDERIIVSENLELIQKLARVTLSVEAVSVIPKKIATAIITNESKIFMFLENLIDFDKERERLQKEIDQMTTYMATVQKKLSNENFAQRAPKEVLSQEREKLTTAQHTIDTLYASIKNLE